MNFISLSFILDPDPAKSFGSYQIRVRIHNNYLKHDEEDPDLTWIDFFVIRILGAKVPTQIHESNNYSGIQVLYFSEEKMLITA